MPGPPPQPIPLRLLRGNPGKRAFKRGLEPERPAEVPGCPDFLVGYACDEWHRVSGGLHALGLLSVLDVGPLSAYCEAYARWRTAEEVLTKMAASDPTTHGLLVKRQDGNAARNPLVKIAADAASSMVRYAAEFGFSPAARARIAAGVYAQAAGKFDGLLGG
jgi:P27 family predicted phage terminase small subunit